MTTTPPRQSGKSVALALLSAAAKGTREQDVLVVTRAQFEQFRKHGIPADQMHIAEEMPKS